MSKRIVGEIKAGRLKPGSRILSITELSQEYGISVKSVRRCVDELKTKGFLDVSQGSGIFVADNEATRPGTAGDIALVVSDLYVPFHLDIVKGVEETLARDGYKTLLANTHNDSDLEYKYLETFINGGVAGVILVTGRDSFQNKYFKTMGAEVKLVLVDILVDGLDADCVVSDDVAGSCEVVSYLLSLGHRKISHLTASAKISTMRNRFDGYKLALQRKAVPLIPELVRETDLTEEGGYQAMKSLLRGKETDFTAVFAANDVIAKGACDAILEEGLKIPEDISIVGFGNQEIGDLPLTTVDQQPYQMGVAAAKRIVERVEGMADNVRRRRDVLATRLVLRDTCAAPPTKRKSRAVSNMETIRKG